MRAVIGVWSPAEDGRLVRVSVPDESALFWADLPEIALKPGEDRVVLIGESVARGYLYDPAFTPSMHIQKLLRGVLGAEIHVVDLARTNLRIGQLLGLLRAAAALEPRAIVLWAGNNWFPLEDMEPEEIGGLLDLTRAEVSAAEVRAHIEELHRCRVEAFLGEAGAIVRGLGAAGIVVVPEFNLRGWADAFSEPPPLARERRAAWAECRGRLLDALAAHDRPQIEACAGELCELDGGLGALGAHARAGLLAGDDPAGARALLEDARDAEMWPKSPRCHRLTLSALRENAPAQGLAVVDLPRCFAAWSGSPLPPADLFLDYCHHSQEGLRIASASIAEAILAHAFGATASARDLAELPLAVPPVVEARARFLAAAHNAAFGQPEEALRLHLGEALAAHDEEARELAGQYLAHRAARAPLLLAEGHVWAPQIERYFGVGGLRRGTLDVRLVRAILDAPGYALHPDVEALALVESHALDERPRDLLVLPYGQLVTMDEVGLEGAGFYRARRSLSTFVAVLAAPRPVLLEMTYRTPDVAAGDASVLCACNGHAAGALPASPTWRRARWILPASALLRGANLITMRWPPSRLEGGEILHRYAESLACGESPAGPYPVVGEIFALTARIEGG